MKPGLISFVGAGPGAPDLITLRGARRLAQADVVIWASSLVPEAVLEDVRETASVHDSAGMTLEDVLAVYAAHTDAAIVRLHSGDPTVFSSISEQIDWCRTHGRDYEIVPGVGSLSAAAAAAGQELTAPGIAQSVVLTRLAGGRADASMPPGESVEAFAVHGVTMAVYLSAARPKRLREELLAGGRGYPPDTPAVIVGRVTWPEETVIPTTVDRLADDLAACGLRTVTLVLVGPALAGAASRSCLYDPAYQHGFRLRSRPGSSVGRPVPPAKRRQP